MANLKAVLQRPRVAESHARNAFDRSCSVNFSYQLGALDCFYAEPFIAGSHVKLNRAIFQRTADVNTAAFPKIDTHVEFFAVPLRLLWTYWSTFKLNIQDLNSSALGNFSGQYDTFNPNVPTITPLFDIHDVLKDIDQTVYSNDSTYVPKYFNSNIGNGGSDSLKAKAVGASRLLAGMGYGMYLPNYVDDQSADVYNVNPFKLLAYQKVYYDHFRNTAYENNDPSYYNVDYKGTGGLLGANDVAKILTYRYVNYRKDYFQSVYPALNYVMTSPFGYNWSIPSSVLYKLYGASTSNVQGGTSSGGQTVIFSPLNQPVSNSPTMTWTTVQQIRASFALDKLLRATAYAPKHVKDQFEARYGVKGVETGNESIRIGAYMNDVIIQEVTNTAANLGEIGGKGVGYNGYGKDIEFTCKEDCIILGLVYSLPRSSYDAYQVANWNTKLNREDFFIPEYMDLGMQPITHGELNFFYTVNWQPNFLSANTILGYKDRYSEYKIGIDRNLGNFVSQGALSDFVVHSNAKAFSSMTAASANYFKVKPTDMDAVFAQNTVPSDITTDKFITHMDIKVICNQNMSIHGQPRLGGLG